MFEMCERFRGFSEMQHSVGQSGGGEGKNKSEGIITPKDARDCAVLFVDRQTKRPEKCEGFTLDVAHRC